jgi:uroporphyrinogen-III decarboxylase
MNDRERMLAVLNRERPDRIPWIPRLDLWYNAALLDGTLPERFAGLSLREIQRAVGAGWPALGGGIVRVEYDDVEIVVRREGRFTTKAYHTPIGVVREVREHSDELKKQGLPSVLKEHILQGPEDYAVWEWVVQHRRYIPTYEAFETYDADVGEDGQPMVLVEDTPFYNFLEVLVGFQNAYYHLADYPDKVEHLLAVTTEVQRQRLWPIIAQSPATLVMNGYHLSSQMTPPRLFHTYILPYYEEANAYLHDRGKWAVMHADDDVSRILDLIEQAGWDMVDCFVTAPMVPLTLAQAREAWGTRVIISGGLPAVLLLPEVPESEFRAYVDHIFEVIAPGDAFVLAVADNVMPNSVIDRIAWVSEQVALRGRYPIV